MAWLESHTSLDKHHKVIRLRIAMRWSKNEAIGFLHRFWWTVLEVSPSGDITALSSPEVMAEMLDMPVEVAAKALKAMEHPDPKQTFLDRRGGRLLVHDWLDFAGKYLSDSKFKRHPEKMEEIRMIHAAPMDSVDVRGLSADGPRTVRDTNQPDQPDQPDQTNQKKKPGGRVRTVDASGLPPAGDPSNLQATKATLRAAVACAWLEKPEFAAAWDAFLAMRKDMKEPAGEHAQQLLLRKLEREPVEVAIRMLEESTMNSWKGVFPLKENHGKAANPGRSQRSLGGPAEGFGPRQAPAHAKAAREFPERLEL